MLRMGGLVSILSLKKKTINIHLLVIAFHEVLLSNVLKINFFCAHVCKQWAYGQFLVVEKAKSVHLYTEGEIFVSNDFVKVPKIIAFDKNLRQLSVLFIRIYLN